MINLIKKYQKIFYYLFELLNIFITKKSRINLFYRLIALFHYKSRKKLLTLII